MFTCRLRCSDSGNIWLGLTVLLLILQLPFAALADGTDPRVQKLYAEAKAAEARGAPGSAIAKYEAILAIAPRLGAAYNNLGLLYFKQRQYAQAAAILEKGLDVDPSMSSASALLGISLYELGKYAEAHPHLEAAVHANSTDANAKLFLANDLIKLDELEAAAAHLQELTHLQPNNQEIWYLLGKVYMQLSQQALSKMNAIDPDSALSHEISGEIMEAMKNYDGALVEYKKAVEMAPHRAGTHYQLGNTYWILSQWDTATHEFDAELANDPNNCMAQWKIGNIMLAQSQPPDQALSEIDKALDRCPNLTQARVDRARALIKLDRNQEALPELQKSAKASPEEPSIHFLLAQTYRALGRGQEAQTELEIFSKLDESARAATAERAEKVLHNSNPH
jgi:tetratricopeptide (TPR) repeat protein